MVDLIEPSEILVDPIELMELCPVERPKVDLNDSTPFCHIFLIQHRGPILDPKYRHFHIYTHIYVLVKA